MSITIGINDFVRRQTPESEYTHCDAGLERVAELALEHFHRAKPGYREGVCLVPVPPEGFFTGLVTLQEGDKLEGGYEARQPGEEPRKSVRASRKGKAKSPAKAVDVILYRRDVLEANNEPCTGCDWDIISINGSPFDPDVVVPIAPMTLIANHFELDGGTPTGMNAEQFEAKLRESVLFWKNKALIAPGSEE